MTRSVQDSSSAAIARERSADSTEEPRSLNETCAQLLARCAIKDEAALAELYRLTSAKLNGLVMRMLGSRDRANDVLQETFVQIWRGASTYRPDLSQPMTWMTAIARNRALDRLKHESRRRRIFDEDIEMESLSIADQGSSPLEQFISEDTGARLKKCMERLAKSQQHAILLTYFYGYTREEVATRLNAPTGTVKSWVHRALQRLEECLTH